MYVTAQRWEKEEYNVVSEIPCEFRVSSGDIAESQFTVLQI